MASEKNSGEQCGFWASFSGPKSNKGYKWTSLVLVLLFLGAGGFVAWFLMKNAAHNLAGGTKYVRLSGTPASYGAEPQAEQEQGFFASEEELATADPSLKRELLDPSSRSAAQAGGATTRTSASAAGGGGGASGASEEDVSGGSAAGSGQGAAAHGSGLGARLSARASGLGREKGTPPSRASGLEPAKGASAIAVASAQAEKDKPGLGAKGGAKPSVMEALKNAFRANLYGARLSSQDSAKEWIAKTFDANQDARLSLEYDEKMKAKLDRVNPDSIPKYLREQNLDAAGAKSLGASDVGKPDFDKEGTKASLKGDKKYQSEKSRGDLAKALFNPLGPFGGGSNQDSGGSEGDPAGPTGKSLPPSSDDGGAGTYYYDPAAEQTLNDIAVEDYVATEGDGSECGCTPETCCCLPANYFDGAEQCPMYGPFLPDDPCGAGMYDSPVGDFPDPGAGGTMFA